MLTTCRTCPSLSTSDALLRVHPAAPLRLADAVLDTASAVT
ncbi:MAG: hypothetical protein AAGA42_05590 [Actinomycetota bacterium]